MASIALVVGNTYYRVTYADRDLTMPSIQPMVYIGEGGEVGEAIHAFQGTVSYIRYGSRLSPGSTDRDDLDVYLLPEQEIGVDLVDLEGALACVQVCLERATSLGWPVLPVLYDGWVELPEI